MSSLSRCRSGTHLVRREYQLVGGCTALLFAHDPAQEPGKEVSAEVDPFATPTCGTHSSLHREARFGPRVKGKLHQGGRLPYPYDLILKHRDEVTDQTDQKPRGVSESARTVHPKRRTPTDRQASRAVRWITLPRDTGELAVVRRGQFRHRAERADVQQ
jgi:hypothetical protein